MTPKGQVTARWRWSAIVFAVAAGWAFAPWSFGGTFVRVASAASQADDLLIVDCLLPGKVRRLGTRVTYVTARKAVKTTASDCAIRGGELALARSRLTELRGALRVAESDYFEAVGTMPDTLEMPARPVDALPASVEEAVPTALDNNPALLTARSEADASQFDKRAARSPLMPTVDLEFRGTGGDNLGGVRGSDING